MYIAPEVRTMYTSVGELYTTEVPIEPLCLLLNRTPVLTIEQYCVCVVLYMYMYDVYKELHKLSLWEGLHRFPSQ